MLQLEAAQFSAQLPLRGPPLPLLTPPCSSSLAPGSVHCPFRPPAPPHFMKPCPLCTVFTPLAPGAQGASPPPTYMHTRAHTYTHMVDTTQVHRAAAPGPPRGSMLSLALGTQPAPETALGPASPGQAGARHPGLPSPGPRSTPGSALKKTGGDAPLAGLWRSLPCPALTASPTSSVSASQEGKGAKQENGSHSPSPRAGLAEEGAGAS